MTAHIPTLFSKVFNKELREENTRSNIHAVKVIAASIAIFVSLFTLSSYFFSIDKYFPVIVAAKMVTVFLLINAVFAWLVAYLIEQKKWNLPNSLQQLFYLYFALVVLLGSMFLSILVQSVQGISLTMFMAGLLCVACLWALNSGEAILLSIISFLGLLTALFTFQKVVQVQVLSATIGLLLLISFYAITRWTYGYKTDLYIQLLQIKQKNEEFERLMSDKMNMLSMVAHDMRNPITTIETIASVLQPTQQTQEEKEMIELIYQSGKKARNIINDIIEAASEQQDMVVELEETNINELIKSTYAMWQNLLIGKQPLILDISDQPIYGMINKAKLVRVLDNLITNAIKFSEDNQAIHLLVKSINGICHISIVDNGIGIPPELMPMLFDRFTKASRIGLRGEKSIGLGLHICRQLMYLMNGDLVVESKPNEGSIFTLKIPQIQM